MEEIDIGQMLGYFKSKIIYIIFAMSIAFCIASIYVNRFRVPEYTSYTTILLNKTNETEINTTDLTRDKSLVSTYGEIIKSKMVLRAVINNLALEEDYSSLAAKVNVSSVTDTSIIKISVTDSDSGLAASIANEIATVFAREIVDIYNIENISIIDVAEISEVPSSISTIKIIGIATIAGAVVAVAVIFVLFYFDTTIKNEEDIERATGLPVIGVVPISREKIKGSAHRKYYQEKAKKHKTHEILPVEREVRKIEVEKVYKEPELVSEPITVSKTEVINDAVLNDEIIDEKVVENNIFEEEFKEPSTFDEIKDLSEPETQEVSEEVLEKSESDIDDDLSITSVLTAVATAIQEEESAKNDAPVEEDTEEKVEELVEEVEINEVEDFDDEYVNKHGNNIEEEDSTQLEENKEETTESSREKEIGTTGDNSDDIEVPQTKEKANSKTEETGSKKSNQSQNSSRNKGKNSKKKGSNSKK